MNDFNYQENRLHCEDYPLDNLASTFGTPCFVYSASATSTLSHVAPTPLII